MTNTHTHTHLMVVSYLSCAAGNHLCPRSSPTVGAVYRKEEFLVCCSAEESSVPGNCAGLPCKTHTHTQLAVMKWQNEVVFCRPAQRTPASFSHCQHFHEWVLCNCENNFFFSWVASLTDFLPESCWKMGLKKKTLWKKLSLLLLTWSFRTVTCYIYITYI